MNALLYCYLLCLNVLALAIAKRGFEGPRSWFALLFLLESFSYLFAYPKALMGYPTHEWLLDEPAMTQYLTILAVTGTISWATCELFVRRRGLPIIFQEVPAVLIKERVASKVIYVIVIGGALMSVMLSMRGYEGYFIDDQFLEDPPVWLDFIRKLLSISCATIALICMIEFRNRGRISIGAWLMILLWSLIGVFTALKTYVVLPWLLLFVAAWLTRKVKPLHIVLLALSIWCAYSVVEPMREAKNQGAAGNAWTALSLVLSSPDFTFSEPGTVLMRFIGRMDYSKEAVRSLEANEFNMLSVYKERLVETYRLSPLLAVVPRALWPDKPLANLGGELSIALDNNDRNSITPSAPVINYLWAGYIGVILNTFLGTYLVILAGKLLFRYGRQPLAYSPIVLLALAYSVHSGVMAITYINVFRVSVVVALLYFIGVRTGIFERPRKAKIGVPRPGQSQHLPRAIGGPRKPTV